MVYATFFVSSGLLDSFECNILFFEPASHAITLINYLRTRFQFCMPGPVTTKSHLPQLIAAAFFIVASVLYIAGWGDFIWHPNQYLSVSYGEGVKAYYMVSYYARHGGGLLFEGMNYPYGQQVIYGDVQLPISMFLKAVNQFFPGSYDYASGVINMLMLWSPFICIFFLCLILRKNHLPGWYSLIMATIIGFLSPQISRFLGHYGLSYVFFIPILWYLVIRFTEKRNIWFWWLMILLTVTVWSLFYPYWVALCCAFFGCLPVCLYYS